MTAAESILAHPAERVLRPSEQDLYDAWRTIIEASAEQEARLREFEPEPDFWGSFFNQAKIVLSQPNPLIDGLQKLTENNDHWLDIGAGIGQVALPLAQHVRHVTALEPSEGCLGHMAGWINEYQIENVTALPPVFWPPEKPIGRFDGVIAKHVNNFVTDIGGFLDAMESHATRVCVIGAAELGTAAQPHHEVFEELHGEKFVRIPGVRELLEILSARRRRFEVQTFDFPQRQPEAPETALTRERQWYLTREGSEKDRRLRELLIKHFSVGEGLVHLPQMAGTFQILVSWQPPHTTA